MRGQRLWRIVVSILLSVGSLSSSFGQAGETNRPPATGGGSSASHSSAAHLPPPLPRAVAAPYRVTPSPAALAYAARELRRMSLDEKVGQLVSIGVNATFLNQQSADFAEIKRQITVNHVGGITLFRSPVYEAAMLLNRMQRAAKLPLLVSADFEAGVGMRLDDAINFPWNMAVGATGDPDYARQLGEMTAREARALGVHQIFAPVADVNNNPANPVINVRSYGEDPAQVARFVTAFIGGAQGAGVIATVKHFPGHGDTAVDSHRGLPVVNLSRARLEQIELVPFRAAVRAGVGAVMSAHIGLPQIDPTAVRVLGREHISRPAYVEAGGEVIVEDTTLPGTLSPLVVGGLLRRDLNFRGLVVTDALDMSGLTLYFTQGEAVVRAVQAGADLITKPADADAVVRGLREAARSGRLTASRIEDAAGRVLAAKYDLGLTKNRFVSLEQLDTLVSSPAALRLAQQVAEGSITLVRNDGKMLPLKQTAERTRFLNLVVTNGDDRLTIADAFNDEVAKAGRRIETVVLDDRSAAAEVEAALARANEVDVVIASLYGRVRSGQARSVGVPEPGARALATLLGRGVPIIGVSFGNPYLLQNFPELKTYLVAYGDMPSLQRAAARAVLGTIPITGRLPITLTSPLYARGTGIQLGAKTNGT